MQIFINTIFPEGEDINMCILHASNSIGMKEIPDYEVKMGEQDDWIKKTQVGLPACTLFCSNNFVMVICFALAKYLYFGLFLLLACLVLYVL